jgi:hypothetical protein
MYSVASDGQAAQARVARTGLGSSGLRMAWCGVVPARLCGVDLWRRFADDKLQVLCGQVVVHVSGLPLGVVTMSVKVGSRDNCLAERSLSRCGFLICR